MVAWQLRVSTTVSWALIIAIALSTQFLFQPFVWSHWPWDEVLAGWVEVARDRVVVALAIASALIIGSRVPARTARSRALALATAIVLGAIVGELLLLAGGSSGERPDVRSVTGRVVHWTVLAVSLSAMYYLWLRTTSARAIARSNELQRVQMEHQIVESRLQVLRNQIEPHFLFNTLATVRRLHQAEPVEGARLLGHVLDYLRLTLPKLHDARTTLGREVDLVRAYLGVVLVRMSGRLRVTFDIPEDLYECEFPSLTLATLVENAVKHGIGPAPDGGVIEVRARRVSDSLEVEVADTGVGFSGIGGSGIGLANVRAHLTTLYGARGSLALAGNHPSGVLASIRLPCTKAGGVP